MSVNGILRARHLYSLATEQSVSRHPLSSGVVISLLQDAVEALAHEAASSVNANIAPTAKFHEYWDRIADSGNGKNLPHKVQMLDLNQARVGFKHRGVVPADSEAERFLKLTHLFLAEATQIFFGLDFDSVSEAELIAGTALRQAVQRAEESLHRGELRESLKACKDAMDLIETMISSWIAILPPKIPTPRPSSRELQEVYEWAARQFIALEKSLALSVIGCTPTEFLLVHSILPTKSVFGNSYQFVERAGGAQVNVGSVSETIRIIVRLAIRAEAAANRLQPIGRPFMAGTTQ